MTVDIAIPAGLLADHPRGQLCPNCGRPYELEKKHNGSINPIKSFLTPNEERVLGYLVEHSDHWISRREIIVNLWDQFTDFTLASLYIHRLRGKLGQEKIVSMHSHGYKWVGGDL